MKKALISLLLILPLGTLLAQTSPAKRDTTLALLERASDRKAVLDAAYQHKQQLEKTRILFKGKLYHFSEFSLEDSLKSYNLTFQVVTDERKIAQLCAEKGVEKLMLLKEKE